MTVSRPERKPLVFIATPCFGGMVNQLYMMSVLRLMQYCATASFQASIMLLGYDSLIPRSRSTLLSLFLDSADATHLLFIDADIAFEPEQVARLVAFDEDFVAAMYPVKALDWAQLERLPDAAEESRPEAALRYVGTLCGGPDAEIRDGFATGLYAGGGFQLIKRNVVERMIAAYPETRYSAIHALRRDSGTPSEQRYALFDCVIEPGTGVYLSEDYAFCWRWRQLGGKIWLDLNSKLTHVGQYDFVGNTAARYRDMVRFPPSDRAK